MIVNGAEFGYTLTLPPPRLYDETQNSAFTLSAEANETEWRAAAAHNPAFAFLHEAVEDIYSLADGQPFHDEV